MRIKTGYTLIQEWRGSGADALTTGLAPHQRLLLLSDGSLTRELELLSGERVDVELIYTGDAVLSEGEAAYLEERSGTDALEREVWLTAGGKRLVYAHSLIPGERVDRKLLDALGKNPNEPLGRVLVSKKIFFSKEKLEVCALKSERIANGFGVNEETAFIARRYVLFNKERDRWVIKAAVLEVFSPGLIPGPALKA